MRSSRWTVAWVACISRNRHTARRPRPINKKRLRRYSGRAKGALHKSLGHRPRTGRMRSGSTESAIHFGAVLGSQWRRIMPQSLSYLLVHVVFSTKDRAPTLDESVRQRLHAYLATVARKLGCECYRVGGVADHVHLAVQVSRTTTLAKLVEEPKTSSSKWMKL